MVVSPGRYSIQLHTSTAMLMYIVPSFFTLLLLGVYVRNFRRAAVSQRLAALSFLKPEDNAPRGKKKFIGFFHPYW